MLAVSAAAEAAVREAAAGLNAGLSPSRPGPDAAPQPFPASPQQPTPPPSPQSRSTSASPCAAGPAGRRERGSLCGRWFFLRVAGPARLPPAQPAFPGTPRPERRSPGKELHNPLDKRSRLGLFFFFFLPPSPLCWALNFTYVVLS